MKGWLLLQGITGLLPWLEVRSHRLAEGFLVPLFFQGPWAWHGAVIAIVWLGFRNSLWLGERGWLALGSYLILGGQMVASFLVEPGAVIPAGTRLSWSWSFALSALLWWGARTKGGSGFWYGVGDFLLVGGVALAWVFGWGQHFALVQEQRAYAEEWASQTGTHAWLTLAAVLGGTVVAWLVVPFVHSRPRLRKVVVTGLTGLQVVPTMALFGLFLVVLSPWGFDVVSEKGALLILVTFACYPIIQSWLTALDELDPELVDGGRALGLSGWSLWWLVQYPLSQRALWAGIRVSTYQTLGNVVVASLMGAGGLGLMIFAGVGQFAPDLIVLGTLPILGMAWAVERLGAVLLSVKKAPL